MSAKLVLISGCSGGGKSTLLAALAARGYATVPEPGRRIVAEEKAGTGKALPWVDMKSFAERALAMARADLAAAQNREGYVFFDRGLVDAAVALEYAGGETCRATLGSTLHYHSVVFLAPPWPEIYTEDGDRKHGFKSAVAEFQRLEAALPQLGYEICRLPKIAVEERAEFVLKTLGIAPENLSP